MSDTLPKFVSAKESHIEDLAANMRKRDVQEAWAAAHLSPERALRFSLDSSVWAYSIVHEGHVLGMFGVASQSVLSDVGIPWFLMTEDLLKDWASAFARLSKGFILRASNLHPILLNYVDVRNTDSIRWLKWAGFKVFPPEPYGPDNMLFHKFTYNKEGI